MILCAYCKQDTGGNHAADCPNNPGTLNIDTNASPEVAGISSLGNVRIGDPLPHKEVISIQRQKAMDLINEAMQATKDEYKVALCKRSFSSCTCMIDNIKRLADIVKSLEVYREQGKNVDVTTAGDTERVFKQCIKDKG